MTEGCKPVSRDPAAGLRPGRHWGGFLASGLIAFSVDAAILEAGIRILGLGPFAARVAAIAAAIVAGWLAHRRLTFAIRARPSPAEFLHYVAAAWIGAVLNYGLYAAALILNPAMPPLAALVLASGLAMVFSYLMLRFGVFRGRA